MADSVAKNLFEGLGCISKFIRVLSTNVRTTFQRLIFLGELRQELPSLNHFHSKAELRYKHNRATYHSTQHLHKNEGKQRAVGVLPLLRLQKKGNKGKKTKTIKDLDNTTKHNT